MKHTIKTKLVGVTFDGRQQLLTLIQKVDGRVKLTIEREPENPFDPNALAFKLGSRTLGYLAKDIAALVAPAVDAHQLQLTGKILAITNDEASNTLGCNVEFGAENGYDLTELNPRWLQAVGAGIRAGE